MSTSKPKQGASGVRATGLIVADDGFTVCLADGRCISVPFACFPRLAGATRAERAHFEVYADGRLLHWPAIDEDIEVQHILDGRLPVKAPHRVTAVAESRPKYGA